MSILNNNVIPVGSTGYDIPYSLRFDRSSSTYNQRTFSASGNQKIWTWSAWIKRGYPQRFGGGMDLWTAVAGANLFELQFVSGNIQIYGKSLVLLLTNRIFDDPSAWYHITLRHDSTQASASNRLRLYVNGEEETSFATDNRGSYTQNYDGGVNTTSVIHRHGSNQVPGNYYDGYMSEVNFIDGQSLGPDSFGETDATYGHWKAIEYTGTYGTNGFYLDFKTSGSLGNDANGSNNFTLVNLAATDQMVDSPTNNFATWNPLDEFVLTFSEGNLTVTNPNNDIAHETRGTISLSGKRYWEVMRQDTPGEQGATMGILPVDASITTSAHYIGTTTPSFGIYGSGASYKDGSLVGNFTAQSAGSVSMFAYDADTGKVWFGLNGTWFNSGNPAAGTGHLGIATDYDTNTYSPAVTAHFGVKVVANFGQDSSFAGNKTAQGNQDGNGIGDFYYAPPAGFLALCTKNLPVPAVVPNRHFNTVLYTGTGAAQTVNTGTNSAPDLVMIKDRVFAYNFELYDSVRGVQKSLSTGSSGAEFVQNGSALSAFNSNGFSIGGNNLGMNKSGDNFVSWNWKAGGAAVSNTDGSITSTVSANVDAGFSIVSYTGTFVAATVGHGLSVAPEMIIVKNRDTSSNWWVLHSAYGATQYMGLNLQTALGTASSVWNNTNPTATVFSIANDVASNGSGNNTIAYCFHSVDGYSKVGSYTGNGTIDNVFVQCGFRPAYLMLRSVGVENWAIQDAVRDTYNYTIKRLVPNASSAESGAELESTYGIDFVSNGFKVRASHTSTGSAQEFIYLAFAETPFKYSNAR